MIILMVGSAGLFSATEPPLTDLTVAACQMVGMECRLGEVLGGGNA